jgi:hypothetical protein
MHFELVTCMLSSMHAGLRNICPSLAPNRPLQCRALQQPILAFGFAYRHLLLVHALSTLWDRPKPAASSSSSETPRVLLIEVTSWYDQATL